MVSLRFFHSAFISLSSFKMASRHKAMGAATQWTKSVGFGFCFCRIVLDSKQSSLTGLLVCQLNGAVSFKPTTAGTSQQDSRHRRAINLLPNSIALVSFVIQFLACGLILASLIRCERMGQFFQSPETADSRK